MSTHPAFSAVAALNLDPIKIKLMHRQSGEGWSLAYANAVEAEYRRFLIMVLAHPQEASAPQFDVDTFWHYHILDTLKYAEDCEAVFGYFLHHFPYAGLRGEADAAVHEQLGARNRALYLATFGDLSGLDQLNGGEAAFLARQGGTAESASMLHDAAGVAYSINVPGPGAQAAYSINVPGPGAQAAYSINVPGPGATLSAYSINVPPGLPGSSLTLSATTGLPQWQAATALKQFFAERPVLKRHD